LQFFSDYQLLLIVLSVEALLITRELLIIKFVIIFLLSKTLFFVRTSLLANLVFDIIFANTVINFLMHLRF